MAQGEASGYELAPCSFGECMGVYLMPVSATRSPPYWFVGALDPVRAFPFGPFARGWHILMIELIELKGPIYAITLST